MRRAVGFVALAGGLALAQAAAAGHMPYLAPKTFDPRRDFVTVEAAMAEEASLFVPDFPIRGAGDYTVTDPAGQVAKIPSVVTLKEFVTFEAPLPKDGTYRISTGERAGRSGKLVKIDGVWRNVRPAGAPGGPKPPEGQVGGPIDEAAIPVGAETMTTQGFLKADTYVTRGAPDRGALKPTGQGLEVAPETHPNEAYAGEAFRFQVLADGKPVPDAAFTVARAGEAYEAKRFSYGAQTGADGRAAVRFDQPGVYVLQVQYPPRVEGAPPAPVARSLTTTLTFEVTR